MNFGALMTAARTWLRDMEGVKDSDRLLTRGMCMLYFNEAIDEACRRARLIVDTRTAAICTIPVIADTASYALDPRIIKINRARITGRDAPLTRYSWRDMDQRYSMWESHTGEVEGYMTDRNSGYLDLYRIPTAPATITLTVNRTPLNPLATDADIPEIAPRYHAKLVPYVIGRCRDIEDSELYDPRKAAKAMAEFENEFGPARPAHCEAFEETQPDYEGEW